MTVTTRGEPSLMVEGRERERERGREGGGRPGVGSSRPGSR